MYKTLNEELMIKACSIGDLTFAQTNQFLKEWGDNSTIASLTIFADEEGNVVINRDRKDREIYLQLAETYLSLDEYARLEMRNSIPERKEEFAVMENALRKRSTNGVLRILGHQHLPGQKEAEMIREICNRYSMDYFGLVQIFNYGVIRGKQMERQH